jgi:hypothetical protein
MVSLAAFMDACDHMEPRVVVVSEDGGLAARLLNRGMITHGVPYHVAAVATDKAVKQWLHVQHAQAHARLKEGRESDTW